jgi:hypothetical protein
MKKNYFLAFLFAFAMISVNAQDIEDDMESYTVGQPIFQDHWTDWGCGGGVGCAIMSSADQALSGGQSGYIPNDGTTDAVLDLGNKIFGEWGLAFYQYVPSGSEGYWNLQGEVPIGSGEWIVGNVFFNQALATPGEGSIDDSALGLVTFNYPEDQWFPIVMNFDISSGISAATWGVWVNGEVVIPEGTAFTNGAGTVPTSLGGIDFFSISTTNNFYLDDVYYEDTLLDPDDFPVVLGLADLDAKGFSAYPNPVNNILNLRANEAITAIAIYNVLGQQVYNATNVDALNTTVDMSRFDNGAYFVKVNVGGAEGTVKVLK